MYSNTYFITNNKLNTKDLGKIPVNNNLDNLNIEL